MEKFKQSTEKFIYTPASIFILTFFFGFILFNQANIVTPDEFAWVIQSIHFRQALIEQDWPRMVQSAHPGFVTMWLGTIGTTIKLWLSPDLQPEINWILQQEWHLPRSGELSHRLYPFLRPMRFTLSLLMAGLWSAVFSLLRQRVAKPVAFFAVMLLITSPWVSGLTNILHVDGLLAMFCTLTLLLVLPQHQQAGALQNKWRYLLAGITMAGAILSKVPGLLLLAIVPASLILQAYLVRVKGGRKQRLSSETRPFRSLRPLHAMSVVLIGLFVTLALLAPILFIDPNHVFQNVFVLSAREVGFSSPTFFLGEITTEPGIFFYPLTALFRQRAVITIGLIFGLIQFVRRNRRGVARYAHAQGPASWTPTVTIGAFCLLFWAGLLVSDRVFARYALPASLPLSLIGATLFTNAIYHARPFRFLKPERSNANNFLSAGLMGLLVLFPPIFYRSDPFSAVNLLVGGPWNGPNLMLTGWGGGQSHAAKQNIGGRIFTDNVPATAPFVQNGNDVFLLTEQSQWLIEPADSLILSLEHRQFNHDFSLTAGQNPAQTIRHAGRDRAWIYTDFSQAALDDGLLRATSGRQRFGDTLTLQQTTAILPDDEFDVHLLLLWTHNQPEDGVLQFTIVDTAGNVWIQREDPLINIEDIPAAAWTPNASNLSIHRLPLASDMPPGDYTMRVSHFRPDGGLSGVFDADGRFSGTVAELATFPVRVPSPQPPVALPENSPSGDPVMAISPIPQTIGQGETLSADIWLKYYAIMGPQLPLTLTVGDVPLEFLLDLSEPGWQKNHVYRIRARWQIPADLPPGEHPIVLNGVDLGTLTVEPRKRTFDIPADVSAPAVAFGDVAVLIGLDADLATPATIRIVWQAIAPIQIDYAIFIHLKDDSGNILAQRDLPPGKPTSQVIADEVVDFSVEFPLDSIDPADVSQIAIGLYDPATGQRLPVFDANGVRLPDDQFSWEVTR